MYRCLAKMMLLALWAGNSQQLAADDQTKEQPNFRVASGEDSLEFKLGEQSIANYYFRHDKVARPFFAHVRTPSGIQVTRNFPPIEETDPTDHPAMHPGIWLAFANINGVNFWHNNDGKVLYDGFETRPQSGAEVRFTTRERYVDAKGKDVCRSVTRHELTAVPSGWMLSIDTALHSGDDLVFTVKEEMGLGMRVATPISVKAGNGSILNASGGKDEQGTWGKHDRWWDYYGAVDDRQVGMMLMSGPDNPPIWSHSRDYGLLVANPFPVDRPQNRDKQTVVKPGEAFRLRFAILVHETTARASIDREAIYERFLHRLGVGSLFRPDDFVTTNPLRPKKTPDPFTADRARSLLWVHLLSVGAVEADTFQGGKNLVERLLAEIRDAQQVFARAIQKISHGENATFLEAVRRADGEADLGGTHLKASLLATGLFVGGAKRNAGHGSLHEKQVVRVRSDVTRSW